MDYLTRLLPEFAFLLPVVATNVGGEQGGVRQLEHLML